MSCEIALMRQLRNDKKRFIRQVPENSGEKGIAEN
jgi:hypothetical protein